MNHEVPVDDLACVFSAEEMALLVKQLRTTGSVAIRTELGNDGTPRHTVSPLHPEPVAPEAQQRQPAHDEAKAREVLAESAERGYEHVIVIGVTDGEVFLSSTLKAASESTLGILLAAGGWIEGQLPRAMGHLRH